MRIHFTTRALVEIDEQADYLAQTSPARAKAFVDALFQRINQLSALPRLGRIVPETANETIRELLYRHYRIIYRLVSDQQLDILTVQTGRMPLTDFLHQ